MQHLAEIPSPTQSVWHVGPLPLRAYALCIIAGILVALWLTIRRWRERGGKEDEIWDVAGWAILFGIIGGRLYHVITDPELYFGRGRHPLDAFKIWDGGLGIWGAIALGTLGAWIGCRRKGLSLLAFADAAVPGVVFAQGIGRWGNWFNNELYGGPTSLPWGLKVHCMDIVQGHAITSASGNIATADNGRVCAVGSNALAGLFQPTFLYESLWNIALGFALLYLDRRYRLGRGNVMALYVMGYTAGRLWIEALREDHANHILGLRLNIWTSIIVFALGLLWFVVHGGFKAERERSPYVRDRTAEAGSGPPPDGPAEPDNEAAGEPEDVSQEVETGGRSDD